MGKETVINRNVANNKRNATVINHNLNSENNNSTVINKKLQNGGNVTSINSNVQAGEKITKGTLLCNKYQVIKRLSANTGEADLYVCTYEGMNYVAKVYRRPMAIKQGITEKLKKINSPFVARLYECGKHNNRTVEILPYYRYGSLQGRKFEYTQLRSTVIPCLNEGLKLLHDNGIIHKDLKPSNIMITENRKGVAIIDFGISSMVDEGNTIVVTQTGMTPEYSAPETYKNLFLNESDYYSFGITLYELYCGKTPYSNMSQEEIEQYAFVQHIPFPKDMPQELQDLITGLTYHDISNRKKKDNPNRRWGYDEVKKWLSGIQMTIPGTGVGMEKVKPYEFLGKTYTERSALVRALVENWEAGKKQLFRGNLSNYFRLYDKEAEMICREAESEATRINGKDDLIFCKTMYTLNKKSRDFVWKDKIYAGLPALGRDLLEHLWNKDNEMNTYMDSVLKEGMLSYYVTLFDPKNEKSLSAVKSLESNYRAYKNSRDREMSLYMTAYMLSGQKLMRINEVDFRTIGEMTSYMKRLVDKSFEEFTEFCHGLIDYEGRLNPQFESWLIALGKREDIAKWQENMKANHRQ